MGLKENCFISDIRFNYLKYILKQSPSLLNLMLSYMAKNLSKIR